MKTKTKKINGWTIRKSSIPGRYNITAKVVYKKKIVGWKETKDFCNNHLFGATVYKTFNPFK